ncbi:unnamed protein product [Soboliphyme baturini]|uniref:RED_C domain-containing protein n=1 Tax=Soboliphyme baturini TaxID=241478 RepID=A0A183IV64_9BILA|nr:unnamed protein product [Soboliphyme baturini]
MRTNSSDNTRHGLKLEIGNGPESYAECYPGELEFYDAAGDSDEEVDYSKMDLGNKKGPVKRWDFDTEQEYEDYMSNREALPKAAFQYGVKMNDGRRTRKVPGAKTERDEKAKLDRQWQKISKVLPINFLYLCMIFYRLFQNEKKWTCKLTLYLLRYLVIFSGEETSKKARF